MKKTLLFAAIFLFANQFLAQDYCEYNNQKGFNFGLNYQDEPYKMIQQPDGRFLIFGTAYTIATNSFHIVGMRLFPNGNPDPSFGNQGKVDEIFNQRNTAICMDLQADGKILVGGYQAPSNGVSSFRPYVARFNADGSVDTDFGDSGSVIVPFEGDYTGEVAAVKVFDDGSIQVISNHWGESTFSTSRMLPNGAADSSYNATGYTSLDFANNGLNYNSPSSIILEDGTSFWVGQTVVNSIFYLSISKVTPNGTLDVDFGENGSRVFSNLQTTFNTSVRSALAFDGNIIVSTNNSDNQPYVLKLNVNDGELVSDFGEEGISMSPIEAIGKECNHLVKDEESQEWILLFGDNSDEVATIRMDDNGNILSDCGNFYNIPDINTSGSQSYTCGMIDQEGVLRISGRAFVNDDNSPFGSQSANFMWPYFETVPAPNITTIVPSQLLVNDPIQVSIYGYGFEETQGIKLFSDIDTLTPESFEVISNEEIQALFYPESIALGPKDLLVYLSNDTLSLEQVVEIVDGAIINADVNVYSRTRMIVGGQTTYSAFYKNRGNKAMLAAPLIIVNQDPYIMDFSNQLTYDFQENEMMSEFIGYLNDQGIDTSLLNSTVFEDEGNQNHAFLTTYLAPQLAKNIRALSIIDEPVITPQSVYLHPNPLVGSDGLLESYLPEPGPCMPEIVQSALLTSIPSVDLTNYESCFNLSYTQLQSDLASIARGISDETVIPFKGAMMKLIFDLMSCVDETFLINESEFELFNSEMAILFANNVILDDEFPCESYVEVSTYYHGEAEQPDDKPQNPAFEKVDPWGLGIDFAFCYGCGTYNDMRGEASLDPNEKIGPTQEFGGIFINDPNMYYAIHFENVDSADIAAKTVLIVDSLDLTMIDVNTFKFTNVSWGNDVVLLNESESSLEIDLRPDVPNILRITTDLDEGNGIVTWLFETLDTLSMMPTEDIDQGFLPPNVTAPEGMGFVGFEVHLLEDIPSGSLIENNAQIYFDFNDPITTNTWVNVFDNEIPGSHVNEITDYVSGDDVVNITWETDEPDPNILFYNIYYNTDGSSTWLPWLAQTTEVESEFTGEFGMTYYFMSVAVDSAFNVEEYADVYDAFIFINPVGIDEVEGEHLFGLYPNPANETVIISIDNKEIDRVIITDMMGRVVLSQKIDRYKDRLLLNLHDMAEGIYYVSVWDRENRNIGQKKLIIQQE